MKRKSGIPAAQTYLTVKLYSSFTFADLGDRKCDIIFRDVCQSAVAAAAAARKEGGTAKHRTHKQAATAAP